MRKFTFILTFYAICYSLPAQESDSEDTAEDIASVSDANEAFDKVETVEKLSMVKVTSLNSINNNQKFQNNVKVVKAAYNVVVQLRAAIEMELDPEKKAELEKKLGAAVSKTNKQNQQMVNAYGFSLQRNYILVIEKSHVYMRVTNEEAELVKKKLDEFQAGLSEK